MPGSDKSVKVALILDASLYGKGAVQASAATSKLGRDMDSVSAKSKSMESGLGKVNAKLGGMGVAAGALAGAGLVAFFKQAVDAAGDLQQSVGGVDAVFKESADTIHAFGKGAAESVGLSTNEFNQLITVTGALLKNKGLEDFAGKSLGLVKTGADLAAQFGGPTSQAVEALNAAMRGESDPIERYGISLSETAVNAELLSKGLSKLKGTALDQAKAQARLDIITRQSADATGTFAREADTLQGQQQRLTAEWKDAQAELGTALLPAITDVTKALRDGVDVAVAAGHAWGEVPGPVKAAVAALVLYHLTSGKVTSGASTIRDGLRRVREELELQKALAGGIAGGYQRLGDEAVVAGGNVRTTSAALGVASKAARGAGSAILGAFGGPVGVAVIGLTAVVAAFAQGQQEAKARVEEFTAAIEADSGALGKNTREAAFNALEKSGAAKAAKELGINLSDLTDAAIGNADAQARVNAILREVAPQYSNYSRTVGRGATAATDALSVAANKVSGAIGGTNEEVRDAVDAYGRHAEAVGTDADATKDLSAATSTATGAVKDQAEAARDAAKAVLDLADAQLKASGQAIDYQDALDAVDERLQKRKELEAELAKAGGRSDRTAHLERNLSEATDPKKRAKIERDLAESRSKDSKKNSDDIARIRKELSEYTAGVDLNTKAGRENQKTLNDLADSARGKSKADIEAGASLKDLRTNMAQSRAEFVESAIKLGVLPKEAEKMADKFGLTKKSVDELAKSTKDLPASKQIVIEAETQAAAAALATLKKQLAGIQGKTVVITTVGRFVNADQKVNGGRSTAGGQTFADGGPIRGHSPHPKADNILIRATAGEYMIRHSAAQSLGRDVLDYLNTYGQLPAGRALGGPVGAVQSASAGKDSFGRGYMTGDLTIDGLNARIRAVVVDENEKATRNTNLRRPGG